MFDSTRAKFIDFGFISLIFTIIFSLSSVNSLSPSSCFAAKDFSKVSITREMGVLRKKSENLKVRKESLDELKKIVCVKCKA